MSEEKRKASYKSLLVTPAGFFSFKESLIKKLFKKSIAVLLIFTFSYSQLLYALDVRQMIEAAKQGFEEDEAQRPGRVTSSQLQSSTQTQENLVDQQNDLVDLQNLNFSLTTQNGDILKYVGDKLKDIQRPDGTRLRDLGLDANGNILQGSLKLPDGSIQVLDQGKVIGYETPDGTQVIYGSQGRVEKTISKDGLETAYSYILDAQGDVTQTILDSIKANAVYDNQNKLKELLDKQTGNKTFYQNGVIQKIVQPDGSEVLFKQNLQGQDLKITLGSFIDPARNTFVFDDAGALQSITLPDNTMLESFQFDANNILVEAQYKDLNGNTYFYDQEQIQNVTLPNGSVLANITWNTDNTFKDLTLTDLANNKFLYQNQVLSQITLPDNSVLRNIVWNVDNSFKDGTLTDSQGNLWTYAGGAVTQIRFSSGASVKDVLWNTDNTLKKYTLVDTTNNQFFYDMNTFIQIKLVDSSTLTNITWTAANQIKDASLTDPQGNVWTYQNQVFTQIKLPDNSTLTSLVWNPDDSLKSFILTDASNTRYLYNTGIVFEIDLSNGSKLTEILWNPDRTLKKATLTDASNNKFYYDSGSVLQIKLPDNSTLDALVWNAQNTPQSFTLTDTAGKKFKYSNGSVIEIILSNNSSLRSLVWNPDNTLKEAVLYSSSGNETYFKDGSIYKIKLAGSFLVENIVWNADRTLKDAMLTDPGNNKFILQNGQIVRITLSNNTFFKDIIWNANNTLQKATYVDTQNNEFYFDQGAYSRIKLQNGKTLEGIIWNAQGRIQKATLTDLSQNKFFYDNNSVYQINLSNGSVVTGIVWDAVTNKIKDALLKDSTGREFTYQNGKIQQIKVPSPENYTLKDIEWNPDGTLKKATLTDAGGVQLFYDEGAISRAILSNGSEIQGIVWNADNTPNKATLIQAVNNTTTQYFYENGIVNKITLPDNSTVQKIVWNSTNTIKDGSIFDPSNDEYVFQNNVLQQINLSGTNAGVLTGIEWGVDGKVLKATLTDSRGKFTYEEGKVTKIEFPDPLDSAKTLKIQEITWNPNNTLKAFTLVDFLQNQYVYDEGNFQRIVFRTNTLTEILWDAQNRVKDALLTDQNQTQWTYQNGAVIEIKLSSGVVLRDLSWNSDNTLKAAMLTDLGGNQFFYDNNQIIRIALSNPQDGILTSIEWTTDGRIQKALLTYNSNEYTYEGGIVRKIKLQNGLSIESIVWDATNKINDAQHTYADGSKFVYQNKLLIQSVIAGTVTNYSYTQDRVITSSQGTAYEYDLTGKILKSTDSQGTVSTYITEGALLGYRAKDVTSSGQTFLYEYQNVSGVLIAQKRELVGTVNNETIFQGAGSLKNTTNPALKFNVKFSDDGSPSPYAQAQAQAGSKTLKVNVVPGTGSTWTFGNTTSSLNMTIQKNILYNVEIRWETGRAAIYVYEASTQRPATPTAYTTNRKWNPTFQVKVNNAEGSLDSSSSGSFTKSTAIYDSTQSYQTQSPVQKVDFKFNSASASNRIVFTATQAQVGDITRTLTFTWQSGAWTLKTSDYNSRRRKTTTTQSTAPGSLDPTKNYIAELRMEGSKANLYVYEKNSTRPLTTDLSLNAIADSSQITTKLQASVDNAETRGVILKNLTIPVTSTLRAPALTDKLNAVKTETLTPISFSVSKPSFSYTQTLLPFVRRNVSFTQTNLSNLTQRSFNFVQTPLSFRRKDVSSITRSSIALMEGQSFSAADFGSSKPTASPTKPVLPNLWQDFNYVQRQSTFTKPSFGYAQQTIALTKKDPNLTEASVSFVQRNITLSRPVFSVQRKNLPASKPGQTLLDSLISFKYLIYNPENQIKEILTKDDERLVFDQGLLKEAYDKDGNQTTFDFRQSDLSNIVGSDIIQGSVKSSYDEEGKLAAVDLGDSTVHYTQEGAIDFIETKDGSKVMNPVFNAANELISAEILTPEDESRVYENGKLVRIEEPDNSELFFLNEQLIRLQTPEEITYKFDYTIPDVIGADLFMPASFVPDALTPIKMQYDSGFNLKKVIRQNQEILEYLDNNLVKIEAPNNLPKTFVYTSEGMIQTQGNIEAFFDKNNNIQKVLIHKDEDNLNELEVLYQYNKIREIYKLGAGSPEPGERRLVFKYSYAFDENGEEFTQIKDLEENTLKTYKNQKLLTSLNQDTSVLSTYGYDESVIASPEGAKQSLRVRSVEVTRFGRTLHSYIYSYVADQTIVTDEELVTRTYDRNQKLVFLEKENQKYAYTYHAGADNQEIVEESLVRRKLNDGSVVHFDKGRVQKVDLPDGSYLSDVEVDAGNTLAKATQNLPDGTMKVFGPRGILEETLSDKTHLYYTDNRITKVIDSQNQESLYFYEIDPGTGEVTAIWLEKEGSRVKYDPTGDLKGLFIKDTPGRFVNPKDFLDRSAASRPVTVYGDAGIDTRDSKVGEGSAYFDGSRDYLTVPQSADFDFGQGDFRIETWVKFNTEGATDTIAAKDSNPLGWIFYVSTVNMGLYSDYNSLKSVPTALSTNRWYHVAVSRSGNSLKFFVDGVQVGATYDVTGISYNGTANELYIGSYNRGSSGNFNGRMDELRISKGPDTKLLLDFEGIDRSTYSFTGSSFKGDLGEFSFDASGRYLGDSKNSILSSLQTFLDSSGGAHPVSANADAKLSTATPKSGNASVYFDGEGDYLKIPDSPDWDFGTGDFTIDFNVRFEDPSRDQILVDVSGYQEGVRISSIGSQRRLEWHIRNTEFGVWNWDFAPNTWYHLALTRQGGNVFFFVNGVQINPTFQNSSNITNLTQGVFIGESTYFQRAYLKGWVDELKILKGDQTVLLLHMDDENQIAYDKAKAVAQSFDNKLTGLKQFAYINKMNYNADLGQGLTAHYRAGALSTLRNESSAMTYTFNRGVLSKATDSQGRTLTYTYEKDGAGNLVYTWVDNGLLKLKYDADNNLLGFKRNGYHDLNEVRNLTEHSYPQGGLLGYRSIDNDFTTAQSEHQRHSTGGIGNVSSEHHFPSSQTVDSITFSMQAYGQAGGNYIKDYEAYYFVEVLRNNVWAQVPGSFGGTYKINGAGSTNPTSGIVTLSNLNLTGVEAIRAFAHGFGNSSDNAQADGWARIYEIQWSLKELANYSYSNLGFEGSAGRIQFDAEGNIVGTPPTALVNEADSLKNLVQTFTTLPNKDEALKGLEYAINPEIAKLLQVTDEAIPDHDEVVVQEYSSDGILETQTKGDQTVTLFENNKPKTVLDKEGNLLIEYSYDQDGNPSKVYLKNARETLPTQILKAKQQIEDQRARSLEELARQKNLAYQQIKDQSAEQRQPLLSQFSGLRGQYNEISGLEAHGAKARAQKGNALGEISLYLDNLREYLTQVSQVEADAYASLDAQVKQVSDKIKSDSQKAFAELSNQERALKKEILRQEISPVVYDYYRRILGRDPDSREYDEWISKIDYDSGELIVGYDSHEELKPGASIAFDGSGDYLSIPDSDDWNFGTGDFTVDFWVKFNTLPSSGQTQFVFSQHMGDTQNYLGLGLYNYNGCKWYLPIKSANAFLSYSFFASPIAENAWTHVALVRRGNIFRVYQDGARADLVAQGGSYIGPELQGSWAVPDYAAPLNIGSFDGGISLNGVLDEFRISKGVARWTGNFTPWTERYQVDSYTKLLLRPDASNTGFKDLSASGKPVTPNGDVKVDSSQYKVQERVTVQTPILKPVAEVLKTTLESSQELQDRTAYVNSVKAKVTNDVNQYLSMTGTEKAAFAQSLGLLAGDLIPLSDSDAQKILVWLNSRSLHFAQSATLSLEALLDQKGIHYSREDIAEKTILIDILSGIITPLDDGDLVLSVFSLNTVAKLYGLDLSGAKLSWEDLQAIYQNNPNARAILHINSNHFVIVTAIQDDRITYIDPGIGKDGDNESLTVTKEGFLKAWKGYTTLENTLALFVISSPPMAGEKSPRLLSIEETKSIRGAFWGSLFNFIGTVLNIIVPGLGVPFQIAALVASIIEGDWISGIASVVSLGFGDFGSFLGDFFKGAFQGITNLLGPLGQVVHGIGQFFGGIYQSVVGFFNSAIGFLPGIGPALQGAAVKASTTIGAQIVNTALSTGLTIGVSKGLEALGVNPELAGFLGNLASGAAIGGLSPISQAQAAQGITQATMIQSNIQQTITLNQVGKLGLELGLDPQFTNIIGLSLAAMGGQQILNPTTPLELAFSNIKPELFSSLGQFGVEKLGISLGLDPRVSALIGTPVSGVLNQGFGVGFKTGNDIITAVNNGILRGATSLGIEYLTQQADLDPLLGSLTSRAITGAIEGALGGGNIFQGIFEAFTDSALNVARLGISGNDPWSQAQYLQRVINFSDIIREKGLAQAIEDSAAQILHEDSISSILKSFNTVGAFIQDQIQGNKPQTIQQEGTTYKKVLLANGDYQIYTADYKNFVEVKIGNKILRGTFGKDESGYLGLKTGTVSVYDANDVLQSKQYIENGWNIESVHYTVDPLSGQEAVALTARPIQGKLGVTFDEFGNYRDADLFGPDFSVSLKDGYLSQYKIGNFEVQFDTDKTIAISLYDGQISNQFLNLLQQNPNASFEDFWEIVFQYTRPTGQFDVSQFLTHAEAEAMLRAKGFDDIQIRRYLDLYDDMSGGLTFSPSDTIIDHPPVSVVFESEYAKLTKTLKDGTLLFPGNDLDLSLIEPLDFRVSAALETMFLGGSSFSAELASNLGLKTYFQGGHEFQGGMEVSVSKDAEGLLDGLGGATITPGTLLSLPEASIGLYSHYENPELSASIDVHINQEGHLEFSFKTIYPNSKIWFESIELERKQSQQRNRAAVLAPSDDQGNLLILNDLLMGKITILTAEENQSLTSYFASTLQDQSASTTLDFQSISRGFVDTLVQINQDRFQPVIGNLPMFQAVYQGINLSSQSLTTEQRQIIDALTLGSYFGGGSN